MDGASSGIAPVPITPSVFLEWQARYQEFVVDFLTPHN
jgi:hypothetical protein